MKFSAAWMDKVMVEGKYLPSKTIMAILQKSILCH
jgi:hypothetical protein